MVAGMDGHSVPGLRMLRLPVRPAWLAVILLGGTVGTALRAWIEGAFAPQVGEWPWATFWINVSGALLLGIVLELLAATGPDRGWRRGVRLGVGTGLLGGYTTYSTFSVETLQLLQAGAWLIGLAYAIASVLLGLIAAFLGGRAVRRVLRRYRRTQGAIR